jgi:CreA protein
MGRSPTKSAETTLVYDVAFFSGLPMKPTLLRAPRAIRAAFTALATICAALLAAPLVHAEEVASVNTNFHITGSDIKGTLGIAEDPTEASIACRQVGAIRFTGGPLKQQADVFTERMSLIFKTLHVVRVVDAKRNTLVYLTYSDRVATGSAKNSVTAVPMPAGTTIPVK